MNLDEIVLQIMSASELNRLSEQILGAAFEVHSLTGPGMLESWYGRAMQAELNLRRIASEAQVIQNAQYKGILLDGAYRLDLLVENKIIVEIKAVDKLLPVHRAQLKTYLKISGLHLGLLVNFNEISLKNGVVRIVHGFPDDIHL